jgi:FlaA1/EpsC-like NDP-sugar epimerase
LHSIVLCWPDATRKQISEIVEALSIFQVPFKKLPVIEDILSERVSINEIREVGIEDLLERPPVETDMEEISQYLRGKTILITGGGGSIGSEICRQVVGFDPEKLIVVERSENSLYNLQIEFKKKYGEIPFGGVISTINDAPGMEKLMQEEGVDVVFHAAAYKHVPLMEDAPIESAYNNVLGTCNVAKAAIAAGVERFVMISTDKAVNPSNIMGATKRVAEMIVQGLNSESTTHFMTVRFGNVLGSAGSVIPIFKKQILDGGPVTVTHPDIERFFMTIPEAVQLVLQAGCMGRGGEIFVLDMGKPVKILKLAEKLITLSGKTPYEDIEIAFTGLRPGEKMYEELFNSGESHIPTSHPRIRAAVSEAVRRIRILQSVDRIQQIIARKDEAAMNLILKELVPGYSQEISISHKGSVTRTGALPGHQTENHSHIQAPALGLDT